jgi:hypothetical protein
MREHPTAPKILVQVGFVVTSVFFPALRYPTLLGTAVLYHAIKAISLHITLSMSWRDGADVK